MPSMIVREHANSMPGTCAVKRTHKQAMLALHLVLMLLLVKRHMHQKMQQHGLCNGLALRHSQGTDIN